MRVPLGTLALALGATGCISTWDLPTCALLVAVALALRELGFGRGSRVGRHPRVVGEVLAPAAWAVHARAAGGCRIRHPRARRWPGGARRWRVRLAGHRRLVVSLAIVVGGAYALYLPFYTHFQKFVSGVGANPTPTDPGQFLTLFGIWLFLLVSFFVLEAHDRLQRMVSARRPDLADQFAARRAWGRSSPSAPSRSLSPRLVSLKVVLRCCW